MELEYIKSGITGVPVLLIGLLTICISLFKMIRIYRSESPEKISLDIIWLLGLLAFLLRLLEQIIRIGSLCKAVSQVSSPENIDVLLVFKGIGDIAYYSLTGFIVLIVSLILWGSLKGIRKQRS
jgi:hypothetical protein